VDVHGYPAMKRYTTLIFLFGLLSVPVTVVAHPEKADNSWWWDKAWWDEGRIPAVTNHRVKVEWSSYERNGVDIPLMIARPADGKKYPAVLFQHGRRGLDDLLQRHVKRLAARGFVVMAPDIYKAHFLGTHPVEHDYELEKDVDGAVDVLLARKDISSKKICLYSHTRGGYYTLKTAVTFKRQERQVACYVSYYPHWQDPNAPEPSQVYGYAPEIEQLTIPTLVFIGEDEQYQRRRVIETSMKVLHEKKRPAQLIIYPGVGRGFDFRPENVRTFADDLAAKDAIQRAAEFMQQYLKQ